MRKITSEMKKAFEGGHNYKNTNTEVLGDYIYLFGNTIARKFRNYAGDQKVEITSAGWKTATTKERLNALENVNITQRAGIWYLNGQEWGGEWVTVKENGEIVR